MGLIFELNFRRFELNPKSNRRRQIDRDREREREREREQRAGQIKPTSTDLCSATAVFACELPRPPGLRQVDGQIDRQIDKRGSAWRRHDQNGRRDAREKRREKREGIQRLYMYIYLNWNGIGSIYLSIYFIVVIYCAYQQIDRHRQIEEDR